MPKCPLFDDIDTRGTGVGGGGGGAGEFFYQLTQLFEHFKLASLDQAEIACLKAIILFRPGKSFLS